MDAGFDKFIKVVDECFIRYSTKVLFVLMKDDGEVKNITYSDVYDGIKKSKGKFEKIGLVKGDRVAIIAPHSPYSVITTFALAYHNITTVLIDPSLPYEEINRLISISDVQAIYTNKDIFENINKSQFNNIPMFEISSSVCEYKVFNSINHMVKNTKNKDPNDDIITIIFSSGTTDSAKGIMITHESVLEAVKICKYNLGWDDTYTLLYAFPLNHITGYISAFSFLIYGGQLGMIENMTASKLSKALLYYNPKGFGMVPKVFELIEKKIRNEITKKSILLEKLFNLLLWVSALLRRWLGINIGKYIFKNIIENVFGNKFCGIFTGGSIVNKKLMQFYFGLGVEWTNFYALTETNIPATMTSIYDKYSDGSVGFANRNDGIIVKINDPDEHGIGEIYIKTKLIMKGYFREPELTIKSFDNDYFKTGDYGYIDKKGYLFITGRIKETIILSGSKKISPIDIDNLYKAIFKDVELACCGIPDESGDYDTIHLFIEKPKDNSIDIEQIKESILNYSSSISSLYKISKIHFIDKIPITSIGKVKRYILKGIALSEEI